MDLIKKLTGKNPAEYNDVAKSLVENSDVKLFEKLVKQDDFLFDFVKNNVVKRIQGVCTQDNYMNLIHFFTIYSSTYDTMFAEVLKHYGGTEILPIMKEIFLDDDENKKAYALKYFSLLPNENIQELLPLFRESAKSDFEPLAINSAEVLSKLGDEFSKNEAINNLNSDDEFVRYNAVKFLVNYQAKDCVCNIIDVMKKSSFSENIASELPYLISIDELLENDFDSGVLVLCNIINALPEITQLSSVVDYNLYNILEELYANNLNSVSATLLMLAKDKFAELTSNDEYLFDCDKNTKNEVYLINDLLCKMNVNKLQSLLYDEIFEESDFVFYAVDFANDAVVLESLLDATNPTLILKVLSVLKERFTLLPAHKELALRSITNPEIRKIIEVM